MNSAKSDRYETPSILYDITRGMSLAKENRGYIWMRMLFFPAKIWTDEHVRQACQAHHQKGLRHVTVAILRCSGWKIPSEAMMRSEKFVFTRKLFRKSRFANCQSGLWNTLYTDSLRTTCCGPTPIHHDTNSLVTTHAMHRRRNAVRPSHTLYTFTDPVALTSQISRRSCKCPSPRSSRH